MTALIRIRDLHKSFRVGEVVTPVLRGVDVEIERGTFSAIVGPSGCGKTTLLALMGALDRGDKGSLVVDGVDLVAASDRERETYRREKLGFVMQFYNLLPSLTAVENVESSMEFLRLASSERRKRALEKLEAVGLASAANKFPAQLSGGMQQRVAVARALARAPAVLLADEPTGNLDQESGAQVIACMRELQRSSAITCVMVTHDVAIASQLDRVIRMKDGRIAEIAEVRATTD